MQLPVDFREFIELMISEAVQFVMIGGFAYNLYRNPRATGDIDFFVDADAKTERQLRRVLEKFGFGETLSDAPLLEKGKVIMLGRSPFRIASDIAQASIEEQRGDWAGKRCRRYC